MSKSRLLRYFLIVLATVATQGCYFFRASPSTKNLFLTQPDKVVELRGRAPFNGVSYLNPPVVDMMHQTYKKIVILPVRVDLLDKEIEKEFTDEDDRTQRIDEAEEIGKYFTDRLRTAIKAYHNYPYELIDKPEPNSIVVEFALVELEPTKVSVNVLGTLGGFFLRGFGLIGRAASGVTAFEAQIRDGSTNEIVIEFRDRETDKTAPFTIKDFQRYAHVRETIDEWADQYAELSATSRNHKVAESFPITLNPF